MVATPAYAQLGGLSGRIRQAQEAKNKLGDLKSPRRTSGRSANRSASRLRQEFGVYQDRDVAKYVSLVGTAVAQGSSRPALDWQFIVLDTDGVNAFASPGGLVHVTRGALGLIKNEAELAGVLGHEIAHVTAKHTVRAIQKNKLVSLGAEELEVPGDSRSQCCRGSLKPRTKGSSTTLSIATTRSNRTR